VNEKRMKKVILVFWALAFLVVPFAPPVSACLVPADLVFEGDFYFDLDGLYYVGGIGLPLNVMGDLNVYDNSEKLGDLFLFGQENSTKEDGETYFGHWVFYPVCGGAYEWEMGTFPDLSVFDEGKKLEFTLSDFNEALGMPEEIPKIVGSLDGSKFEGTPIPIPPTLLLLGSGLLGVMVLRRRKIW
jgi:hypothetical protein